MIYLFLADGFEEIEALATADVIRRSGQMLQLVGVGTMTPTGSHQITVQAEVSEEEIRVQAGDMVILPGGMPGSKNLENSQIVRDCVRYCAEKGRVAAICAAPFVLGHLGILNGRRAICYPGFESELIGAQIAEESVCVDGNIITAKGAGVAVDFGLAIVHEICGEAVAKEIHASMQCR